MSLYKKKYDTVRLDSVRVYRLKHVVSRRCGGTRVTDRPNGLLETNENLYGLHREQGLRLFRIGPKVQRCPVCRESFLYARWFN